VQARYDLVIKALQDIAHVVVYLLTNEIFPIAMVMVAMPSVSSSFVDGVPAMGDDSAVILSLQLQHIPDKRETLK
jgi:Na+/H+ antiporter NhaD/arsenite permease-like protein